MWKIDSKPYLNMLLLAGPIYAGLLAQNLIGLADTAFLGRAGNLEQQAGGYGALCFLVVFVIGFGFALGLQIRMGQAFGARKADKALAYFRIGLKIMFLYGLLIWLFFYLAAETLLYWLTGNAALAEATSLYLQWRAPGALAAIPALCFYSLAVSSGDSRPVGLAYVMGAALNIGLDYFLIFGKGPFPALGLAGAGLASTLADVGILVLYFSYFVGGKRMWKSLFLQKLPKGHLHQLWKTASPLILQNALSMASWFGFFTLIERTGDRNFQLSIILRSVYGIFMIGGISLGSACNSMVSRAFGAEDIKEIPSILTKGTLLAVIFSLGTGWVLLAFPTAILGLFSPDPALGPYGKNSLGVIYLGLLGFAMGQVWFNGLSATGKTLWAFWAESLCVVLYIGWAAAWVFGMPGAKSHQIWTAEWVYGFSLLGTSYLLLRRLLPKIATQTADLRKE